LREGDEIVHALLAAMASSVSYKTLQRTVHIHPTVSEFIPMLLASLRPLCADAQPDAARAAA
jgi:hypothetical protein